MSLTTDENATAGTARRQAWPTASMTNTFTTTGRRAHSTHRDRPDQRHQLRLLCPLHRYGAATRTRTTSSSRSPSPIRLRRRATSPGRDPAVRGWQWDSPGPGPICQRQRRLCGGLNAQATAGDAGGAADQYSEITYDQDPGSASWVGVTTRYKCQQWQRLPGHRLRREVRLYRADDSGSLNFTLLASASANVGTAPRRLRLESEGNTQRLLQWDAAHQPHGTRTSLLERSTGHRRLGLRRPAGQDPVVRGRAAQLVLLPSGAAHTGDGQPIPAKQEQCRRLGNCRN